MVAVLHLGRDFRGHEPRGLSTRTRAWHLMQYIGGKQKSGGAQIAQTVNAMVKRRGLRSICEPSCGGLSVTSRFVAPQVFASDACVALITLYCEMRKGWRPPDVVTREGWERLRAAQDPTDPMTAFAGFGCSRSGNWFSAFVEDFKRTGDNYVPAAVAARESLENKLRRCANVVFRACDFADCEAADLYYCDPPYKNTIPYKAVPGEFDHDRFWSWARKVSESRFLAVSERVAPADFAPLLTFSLQNRLTTKVGGARRTEHLFVHESQLAVWRA